MAEVGDLRVAIDPFLGEHELRLFAPPGIEILGERLDWLLATHEHLDHLDTLSLPAIADRHDQLRILLPTPLIPQVERLVPRSRIVGVTPGDVLALSPDVEVEVVPAFHGVTVQDGYTTGAPAGGAARFVGYVLRGGGITLYHSGDTLITTELVGALEGLAVDVALLPVNGRDYYREQAGLVGNMNVREAVRLAQALGVDTLVPMHWDMFRGNTERPGAVLDEVAESGVQLNVVVLDRMRPFRFVRA